MNTITTSHNYMHTVGIMDGTASALCATDYKDPPTVTLIGGGGESIEEPIMLSSQKGHNAATQDGVSTTLTVQEKERPMVSTSTVRRLTPMECERLQAFPDNWSKYGNFDGEVKELSDAARYRLQGNSIARPYWTWLLRRIAGQYEREATLGSLFDGQAGFCLCAVEAGIRPVWSSEIEKNAVAVAKYHFPEETP